MSLFDRGGWRLLNGEASQFPCSKKDAREHGAVEPAGVGVTQRRVIGGEKMKAVGEKILDAMGEAVIRFAGDDAGVEKVGEVAVEGDLSEADDDTDVGEGLNFAGEMSSAVTNLLRDGLVTGRSAANDGGDPGMTEFEAIVAGDGARFAGEAKLVEDGIHEIARAVTGKGATGAIGPVGAWSEAKDEYLRFGVAESGDRASPISLVLVGTTFSLADAATVVAETRA
jgi:hypothetical protein